MLLSPQLPTVSSRRQSEFRSDPLPPRESGLLAWQRLQKHRSYIWGFGVCNERLLGVGTKGSVCLEGVQQNRQTLTTKKVFRIYDRYG